MNAVRWNLTYLLAVAFRNPVVLRAVIRYPRIAALGFAEGGGDAGLTFGDLRDHAYDMGRAIRRIGWDE